MSDPLPLTIVPLGSVGGTSEAVDVGDTRHGLLSLRLRVETVDDSNLGVIIETSNDGVSWVWLQELIATEPGEQLVQLEDARRYVRATWSDSVASWLLDGTAHSTYCSTKDIKTFSVAPGAWEELPPESLVAATLAATDEADSYLSATKTLPLLSWGSALRMHCANLAAAVAFRARGVQPDGPDDLVFQGRKDAIAWLTMIAKGTISPPDIIDSTPEEEEGGVYVYSDAPRGW